MAIFIGFESANSFVKSVSSINESELDIYLNTLTVVDEKEAINALTGKHYEDIYEVVLKGEKLYYRVGLPLESDNQTSSSSDDFKRYETDEWKVESLIAIYKQLDQAKKTSDFLYVTTGVPTKHAGIPSVIAAIKKQLEGTHTINGRDFLIKEVAVITQGESTYYHELLNDKGESNIPFVVRASKKNLMYIDIGHGTADFCAIQKLVPGKRSQEDGMISVWEKIKSAAENLDDYFKVSNPPILGFAEQLHTSDEINFNNIRVDVKEVKEKEMQQYAEKILNRLSKDGLEDLSYNEIIFCGGGSVGLKPYLEQAIHSKYEKESLRARFRFLNDAQAANASGYLKYGLNSLSQIK